MKNEIKEILDNLRIYAGREENGFICDIENYITNLQDKLKWYENIDPNKTIDKFRYEHNMKVKNLQNEIARLNKIIDKLEKWLEEKRDLMYDCENPKKGVKPYGIEKELYHTRYCVYCYILDKLEELKEKDKNKVKK